MKKLLGNYLLGAAALLLASTGCGLFNPDVEFCERYIGCREISDADVYFGEDGVDVCVEEQAYYRDVGAANDDSDCSDRYVKRDELRDCAMQQESCGAFLSALTPGFSQSDDIACEDEFEAYVDARNDADDCTVPTGNYL